MMMRGLILLLIIFSIAGNVWGKTVHVGLVVDGASSTTHSVYDVYKKEIKDLLEPEHDVVFVAKPNFRGDWTLKSVQTALDAALNDKTVDLVVTLGIIGSHLAANRPSLEKPVVAPFIIDPAIQIKQNPVSPNLNIITFPTRLKRDMALFSSLIQSDHISVFISKPIVDAIPELMNLTYWEGKDCCPLRIIMVDSDIDVALQQLPKNTKGVYLAGLPHLSQTELKKMTDRLTEKKLPTFSLVGKRSMNIGVMASSAGDDVERIARTAALTIQMLVLGSVPEKIIQVTEGKPRLLLNRSVARKIGFVIPYAQLIDASFVGDLVTNSSDGLSISKAVSMAVKHNADLESARFTIDVAKEQIEVSRSRILPNMNSSMSGVKIDKDRAKAGMGMQAEETIQGSLTLSQVVYSEQAFADLNIQKSLLTSKKKEVTVTRLDIMEATAIAYLNVLKAQTFLKIQQDNLEKTRRHLEIARIRESVGQAGPAEVYRWMNIIATSKQKVIFAINQQEIARTEFNRLIGEVQGKSIALKDLAYNAEDVFGLNLEQLKSLFDNPVQFRKIQDFMVKEAVRNAPEMQQLDAVIAAQKRLLLSKKRSFYHPTVALSADVTHRFARNGEGQSLSLPIPVDIDERDDTDWTVGITMSLPIFEGGGRSAKVKQERANLRSIMGQKLATRQRIEQRMRTRMIQNYTSYSDIQLSKEAAGAARKSLDLIEDSYARGVGSILDLIDAQNAVLVSELVAANAMYSFYMDYIHSERAAGNMNFEKDPPAEVACWMNRMSFYLKTETYRSDCGEGDMDE